MPSIIAVGLAALLLASASATDTLFLRSADVLSRSYSSILLSAFDDVEPLSRRTSTSSATNDTLGNVPLNPDGSLNLTAWNAATTAACAAHLRATLDRSSNPSGTCICYNLPSLDADSGAFAADLRLFRMSEPTGDFAGVAPGDVRASVAYANADVSMFREQYSETDGGKTRRDGAPELLQSYMFVGKIHPDKMSDNMSIATLEALVMPILTLTANSTTSSTPARTTVSPNEAAFLAGVFSESVVLSNFTSAQAAVGSAEAALKNGTAAFVMPGTQLLILPIGASITGAWLLAGMVAVGVGTVERMRFAESYRRRQGAVGWGKTL